VFRFSVSKNSIAFTSPKKDQVGLAGGKEGIYLDEITGKQDDPEITALYLYGPGRYDPDPLHLYLVPTTIGRK